MAPRPSNSKIGAVDFERIYRIQQGRCGICHRPYLQTQLKADTNHETQRVRGLLCNRCNFAEGMVAALQRETGHDIARAISQWIADDGFPDLDVELGQTIRYDNEAATLRKRSFGRSHGGRSAH